MSCCKSAPQSDSALAAQGNASRNIVDVVNSAYSKVAKTGVGSNYAQAVATAFGYTEEQLLSVPEGSHMGLSCGNPVASATIKKGEVVVDLGSGGGIDVFLAAKLVGETGQVIGLDMSQNMIELARRNAAKKGMKPPHVSFVRALLTESLPIESNSVDCILSNCVINLLPESGKAFVMKEMYRILKPGGRAVLDDIIAKKPLPDFIKDDLSSYVACISGALQVDEYKDFLQSAGFKETLFVDTKNDLDVYFQGGDTVGCCAAVQIPGQDAKKPDYDVNEWAASYQIYVLKTVEEESVHVSHDVLLRWWDAYPVPTSTPPKIPPSEVAGLIRDHCNSDIQLYVVIDVRRDDRAGGHVRGSHSWFAQSFFDDLHAFYDKFKTTPKVIFYCQSSNGRGPRAAAWYQDYLDLHKGEHASAAFVLEGGIKSWIEAFKGEDDLVDFA